MVGWLDVGWMVGESGIEANSAQFSWSLAELGKKWGNTGETLVKNWVNTCETLVNSVIGVDYGGRKERRLISLTLYSTLF